MKQIVNRSIVSFAIIFLGSVYLFGQENTFSIICKDYELVDQLRSAFEEQISQVYKIENQSDGYAKFLNYMSFDPMINSWVVQLSRMTIVDSLRSHSEFYTIWTNENRQQDDVQMEVVVLREEDEEPEIWDVDTESKYFKCLTNTEVELLSRLLVDIKKIGGFFSPRMISSILSKGLEKEDYSDRELRNFISINLYFTTLINLSLAENSPNDK